MKKLILTLIAILGFGTVAFALPYYTAQQTIIPFADNSYDLGTSTSNWRNIYTKQLCLTGDCKTAWPTGGSGTFPFTSFTGYNATSTTLGFLNGLFSTASSTFSGPFNLSALSNGGLAVFSGLVSSGATTTAGTGLTYTGNAFTVNTSQNIATLSNLTGNGAILTSGGIGTLGTYTGTSCTNQFVRSLSGSIAASCATVGASDVSLAALTATNSTLTFSGTYDGSTARTIGLNLGNANTWTAIQTFTPGFRVATTTSWLNSIATLVGTTTIQGQFTSLIASSSAVAASYTVDWSSGNTQRFIINQASSFVINATSSNPLDGGKYTLKICQDGVGSRVPTFVTPGQLRWWNGTTTISSAANTCSYIGMIYDSTYGIYSVVASSTGISIN